MKAKVAGMLAAAAALTAGQIASAQYARWTLLGGAGQNEASRQMTPEQRFVHPITSPYYHEDSFVTNDVRLWFAYHQFPDNQGPRSPIFDGDAQVYAAQVRLAVTDQIQFVAYKDGYTVIDANEGALKASGWNDIGAGVKWNFIQDWGQQFHAAVGAGLELPLGDPSVLQNQLRYRAWASVNKGFDRLHLGATLNVFVTEGADGAPFGTSDFMSGHIHVDYYVNEYFSPVLELNGYYTYNRGPLADLPSGLDVGGISGGDFVLSAALGAEVRPLGNDVLGVRGAFEFPLTNETDLFGWRLTTSVVFSF